MFILNFACLPNLNFYQNTSKEIFFFSELFFVEVAQDLKFHLLVDVENNLIKPKLIYQNNISNYISKDRIT